MILNALRYVAVAGIYPPPSTVWGLGDGNMVALLNFTKDRIIYNEGCANVLYIPGVQGSFCHSLQTFRGKEWHDLAHSGAVSSHFPRKA